jgi:hypothetical protein
MLLFPQHCCQRTDYKEQLIAYELTDSPLNYSFALNVRLFEIHMIRAICNIELVDYPIVYSNS